MARTRTTYTGEPGEVWTNDTGKVQYQFIANWINTCGLCAQYDHQIAASWPIPMHRGCKCRQILVRPGQQAQPFTDFRATIAGLDPLQQSRVVGRSNLDLINKGVVTWEDVVTRSRVRDLREVVAKHGLTVKQLTAAGVQPRIAEEAYRTVHTPAHELAEARRKELLDQLLAKGLEKEDIRRALAERLAARVGISSGPSGPGSTGITPTTPKPPPPPPPMQPAPARKKKPTPPPLSIPAIAGGSPEVVEQAYLASLGVKPAAIAKAVSPLVAHPGLGVNFTPSRAAKSQRYATVWVDVAKLDEAFQQDSGFAIKPGGEGAIPGRLEEFERFLARAKAEGIAIEQSEVVVDKDGRISFVNGRHRFAVMRDMGVTAVPISVPRGQARRAEKFFGVEPPTAQPDQGPLPAAPKPGEPWTVTPDQAREWVKDSVIPVPLYHRTYEPAKADIEENGINMDKANGVYGQGLYVSTKPEKSFGPATVEVALNIRNPLIGDMDTIQKMQDSWPKAGEYILPSEVRAEALRLGYDAIVVHLDETYQGPSGHNWIVVIKPEAARFVKR